MSAKPEISSFLALSPRDLTGAYTSGISKIHPGLADLTEEKADRTFDGTAGAWSCRMLLGHLLDAEIAFVHRMRRAVAEERPAFTVWQEDDFIDKGLYRSASIDETMQALRSLRNWTASWLKSLAGEEFNRVGLHPQRGEQTVHTILSYCTWHLEHHAHYLDEKMKRLV